MLTSAPADGSLFRKSPPGPTRARHPHLLFIRLCIWLCVDFWIHLGSSSVQGHKYLPSSTCGQVWPPPFIEDAVFSPPSVYFWLFLFLNQRSGVYRCVDLRLGLQFNSTDQWVVLMPMRCGFYHYSSLVQLEIGNGEISIHLLIMQDCFRNLRFFFSI